MSLGKKRFNDKYKNFKFKETLIKNVSLVKNSCAYIFQVYKLNNQVSGLVEGVDNRSHFWNDQTFHDNNVHVLFL